MSKSLIGKILFGAFLVAAVGWPIYEPHTPQAKARSAELKKQHQEARAYAVANGLELLSQNDGVAVLRDNKTGCHWLESRGRRSRALTARTTAGPDGNPVQLCEPIAT